MPKYLLLAASLALASCAAQKALPQYTSEQQAAQREIISYWRPDSLSTGPRISPAARAKLDARRRRGQAPTPLASDGGLRPLDSLVALPPATPQPGRSTPFWQKVNPFRKQQTVANNRSEASLQKGTDVPPLPRKCKGCTIVYGDANVAGKKAQQAVGDGATASVIEKKAGPAVVASDSSTQNAILGAGNLAAVHGDGNTLPQTKQDTTTEAPGMGATIAKALTGPLGYVLAAAAAGGLLFLFIRRRAKKVAENLV